MFKIKIAVIGCGTIAKTAHIRSYMANEECEIKYFCDIIEERAKEAVEENGCGTAITDYKIALNDPEIVAVSVCTPNDAHEFISIDALKAGKHVLCEKPAARTYDDAVKMQKAAHESGKILNIGVVNRFNTGVNKIKKMILDGKLGDIYHVYISFRAHRSIPGLGGAFTTKAKSGGGVLIDWGVHYIDIVMHCLGDPEPRTVSGKAHSVLGCEMEDYTFVGMWAGPPQYNGTYDVDDFVTAFVRTDDTSITMNGAWAQNIGIDEGYIDFIGTKGGIRLQYGGDFVFYGAENGSLTELKQKYQDKEMFQAEIDQFINAVKTGEKGSNYIDKAIITAKLMQAIYDSSDKNAEVAL